MENKYQEVLDFIKKINLRSEHYVQFEEDNIENVYEEEINILQELVDKEKPKKVFINKECKIVQCPNCKVAFTDYIRSPFGNILRYTKRCDDCGQVLDWSVEE